MRKFQKLKYFVQIRVEPKLTAMELQQNLCLNLYRNYFVVSFNNYSNPTKLGNLPSNLFLIRFNSVTKQVSFITSLTHYVSMCALTNRARISLGLGACYVPWVTCVSSL